MKLHLTLKSCVDPENLNEALNPSSELLLLADPELMHNNTQDGYIYPAAFTCSKLTIETLEQRCEICSKLRTPMASFWSLLLTLNIFPTFVPVFLLLILNMQLPAG